MANQIAALNQAPRREIFAPPDFPTRPDLFDEVEWGPIPGAEDIRKAYKLWSLQDSVLEADINIKPDDHPYPNPETPSGVVHRGYSCLAHNVYEHLMQNPGLPLTDDQWNEDAQMRVLDNDETDTGTVEGWSYKDIFGVDPPGQEVKAELEPESVEIQGHFVMRKGYWKVRETTEELRKRGIAPRPKTKLLDLQRLLAQNEIEKLKQEASSTVLGFLPREDQSQWGIPRKDDYMLTVTTGTKLRPLDMYTWAILLSPYNPTYWVSRAYLYYQMGYFDLALGDAHRAQLLCEIISNHKDRNQQPGLYIRIWNAVEQHVLQIPSEDEDISEEAKLLRQPNGVNYFIPTVRKALHQIMSLSLLALQCWKDYNAMEEYLTSRTQMSARDKNAFTDRKRSLEGFAEHSMASRRADRAYYLYERYAGTVSGRMYPYSARDIDRAEETFRKRIDKDILCASQAKSEKLEVRYDEIGLGVFAKEEISSNEIIYVDEPSARGHLFLNHQVTKASKTTRCQNCKREISAKDRRDTKKDCQQRRPTVRNHRHRFLCPCVFAKYPHDEVYWCPPTHKQLRGLQDRELHKSETDSDAGGNKRTKRRKLSKRPSGDGDDADKGKRPPNCLEIARELYHYRACGVDWSWLHDAMRPNWNRRIQSHREVHDIRSKDTKYSHTNETHCTVLSLLLREIFDMTLLRREKEDKPNLLAHEIEEMMPLMGSEDLSEHRFPFTLAANIKVPFDILLCLGVDIFRDLTFDTWVIQTVLRKLLLNAVPWDEHRRGPQDRVDVQIKERIEPHMPEASSVKEWEIDQFDPTIRDLYLFPGLSMFNHACRGHSNATWEWDKEIPNRVKVTTSSKIRTGQEILLPYRHRPFSDDSATRVLGEPCLCTLCDSDAPPPRKATLSPSSSSSFEESESDKGASRKRSSSEESEEENSPSPSASPEVVVPAPPRKRAKTKRTTAAWLRKRA